MTITVITKSRGRRSFDAVDCMKMTGNRLTGLNLTITYFTESSFHSTVEIPMNDIIGFFYGMHDIKLTN